MIMWKIVYWIPIVGIGAEWGKFLSGNGLYLAELVDHPARFWLSAVYHGVACAGLLIGWHYL